MLKFVLFVSTVFCTATSFSKTPKIVMVTDLSTNKRVWKEVVQGADLAVVTIQKQGGKILFTKVNSGSRTVGTSKAMNDIVVDQDLDVIILDIDSSKAEIAAEISEAHRVAAITPYATSPTITKGRKHIFRACVSDSDIAKRLAKMAINNRQMKIAIVYDAGQLYSVTLSSEFQTEYLRLGGQIVYNRAILDGSLNYKKIARELVNASPDVLFLPFYEETVRKFLVQAVEIDKFLEVPLIGSDGWASGNFFLSKNTKISKMTGAWISHHNPNPKHREEKDFLLDYKILFGQEPVTSAASLGYDSVMIAYRALTYFKTGTPTAKLKAYLGYKGASGPISFDENNEPKKPLYILEYRDQKVGFKGKLR